MKHSHHTGELELIGKRQALQFRLLGILPLVFFLTQSVHYWRLGQLGHMLWMCNIGNLLLALGLFFQRALLVRIAGIWMFPGLVIWLWYVAMQWGSFASSTLAHVGGLVVGLIALQRVRFDRITWRYAVAWFLMLQLVSRIVTPAELNVNVAFSVYGGWQTVFNSYWRFWLVMTGLVASGLWLIGLVLGRTWPPTPHPPNDVVEGSL